jgi:hypothetical protein
MASWCKYDEVCADGPVKERQHAKKIPCVLALCQVKKAQKSIAAAGGRFPGRDDSWRLRRRPSSIFL